MQAGRRLIVLALLALLAACGAPQSAAKVGATASPATSSEPTSSMPSSNVASSARTPAAVTPVPIPESLGLTCALPVAVMGTTVGNRQNPDHGAVIDFQSGRLIAVPAGDMKWHAPASNVTDTVATPVLHGFGGVTDDRAAGRWLPVERRLVSPDGSKYAYGLWVSDPAGPTTPSQIHLVDVATGVDKIIYSSSGPDFPVAFTADGIYLDRTRWEVPGIGLQLLDPNNGQVSTIDATGSWVVVGSGGAWGFPDNVGGFGDPIPVVNRLDLKSGQITQWLRVTPPDSAWVVGFDAGGHPIVDISRRGTYDPERYEVLPSPGVATPLFSSDVSAYDLVTDQHGQWLAGPYGVYLFAGGTLHFVFAALAANQITNVSGDCV